MTILINNHRFIKLLGTTSIFCLVVFHAGDVLSQNVGINQPDPEWPSGSVSYTSRGGSSWLPANSLWNI